MLIRFEVANFRSVLHPVELSMVAVDRDRVEARPVPLLGESLLPVAAIYGPNASGKSNVLAALGWLRSAVQDSLREWDDDIPVDPFAFVGDAGPSTFTVESVIAGVRFEYVVELDGRAVHYEGLFHYPEKKRRRIFEREGTNLTLQRGLGNLSGTRELLTARTLALTVARRFDEPLVSDFARHLLDTQTLGRRAPGGPLEFPRVPDRRDYRPRDVSTHRLFPKTDIAQGTLFDATDDDVEADRQRALALLRMADLGIEGVVIERRRKHLTPKVRLVHRAGDDAIPLEFSAESEGTRTWFELIGPVLSALREGSLVLFDELDASLHPTLSMHLIRLFTIRKPIQWVRNWSSPRTTPACSTTSTETRSGSPRSWTMVPPGWARWPSSPANECADPRTWKGPTCTAGSARCRTWTERRSSVRSRGVGTRLRQRCEAAAERSWQRRGQHRGRHGWINLAAPGAGRFGTCADALKDPFRAFNVPKGSFRAWPARSTG